ncbi:MAG TPA: phosphatidylglycerophosphatase A [Rhizomicrobium sp.]|nr:phosphatidylglycerophosphatase A [Rhizomicrobium sp.]
MMEQPSKRWPAYIATLFGIGRTRYAPGTVTSLVALPFAAIIHYYAGSFFLLLAAILASAVGAWACDLYSKKIGKSDPAECVIDELAGQWLACAFAHFTIAGYVLAFVLFRLFDITKLWPISLAERVPGGVGIMLDDIVAAVMAGAILAAAQHWGVI